MLTSITILACGSFVPAGPLGVLAIIVMLCVAYWPVVLGALLLFALFAKLAT